MVIKDFYDSHEHNVKHVLKHLRETGSNFQIMPTQLQNFKFLDLFTHLSGLHSKQHEVQLLQKLLHVLNLNPYNLMHKLRHL